MVNRYSSSDPGIYILNRNNYNSIVNYGDNIFFVRENSQEANNIVSLYVGESRQCDLLDVTNICKSEAVMDDIPETDTLTHNPIFPKTVKLYLDGNTDTENPNYADIDGDGNLYDIQTPEQTGPVGTINYKTGLIIYLDVITPKAVKASYFYSTIDMYFPQNNYNLNDVPTTYQIPNKMFLYEQLINGNGQVMESPYYKAIMWNEDEHKFIDCSPEQLVLKDGTLMTTGKNIISGNDMPLQTFVETDSQSSSGSFTFPYLPRNGGEFRLTNELGFDVINIVDITKIQYYQGGTNPIISSTIPEDYISFIVFKKGSSVSDIKDLMGNFTDDNNKIYLLNPDKDISELTVIHILLYNDGFHICAIVSGYNENAET